MTTIFELWHPQYITVNEEKQPRDIVDNVDWNKRFNLGISQGNNANEALDALINTGLLKVQLARYAEDAGKLGGKDPSYYAARENVLGLDEQSYRPNSDYMPAYPEQPTPKRYVDNVFDEYTIKYAAGITLKGVYETYAELIMAHPKGNPGDAYIAGENIYVWDYTADTWYDAGPIRGPQGIPGEGGLGVPLGGATGQFLQKKSSDDYDVHWNTLDLTNYTTSTTLKNIDVGPVAPKNPKQNDIWFQFKQ